MEATPIQDSGVAHQAWYEPENDDSTLTMTIINAVSRAKNTAVDDLDPLGQYIDADGLETLFCPLQSGGFAAIGDLRFHYEGLQVHVHSTGQIHLYEQ